MGWLAGREADPARLSLRQPETASPGMRLRAGEAVPSADVLHGGKVGADYRCPAGEVVLGGGLWSDHKPGPLCDANVPLARGRAQAS